MAATATQLTGVDPKSLGCEVFALDFTSTTATVEVTTGFQKIWAWQFSRAGDANAANFGDLTIDETVTADGYIDSSAGAITVDRHSSAGDGTLAAEKFSLFLWGE